MTKYTRVHQHENYSLGEKQQDIPPSVLEEIQCQSKMAWPVIINMVSYRAPWVISIAFVGRLGESQLASAALASTLANVSGLSIVMGLSNAQSTLSSQAYGGKEYARVGLELQRSIIVFGTACIFISLLWGFGMEPFLVFTGQDPDISKNSAQYLRILIPGLFGNAMCIALQRFLQAQGITKPPAVAALITALLHAPLNWFIIHKLGFGLYGVAAATSLNQILTPIALLAISYGYSGQKIAGYLLPVDMKATFELELSSNDWIRSGGPLPVYRQCWYGWSLDVLEIGPMLMFLKLAFAGMIMVLEWWASEIAILMAGAFGGSLGLSAMSLYQTTNSLCYMFCKGYEVSTTTRVGTSLGAGLPRHALLSAKVGPTLAGAQASLLGFLLLLGRQRIPLLFTGTTDEGRMLAERVGATYSYLAVYVIGDAMSAAFGGAITGCGRQRFAALVVLFSYGVVGLPVCYLEAKAGKGYLGIVAGMTLGTLVQCFGNMLVVACTDFEHESELARARLTDLTSDPTNKETSTQLSSSPLFAIIEPGEEDDDDFENEDFNLDSS